MDNFDLDLYYYGCLFIIGIIIKNNTIYLSTESF